MKVETKTETGSTRQLPLETFVSEEEGISARSFDWDKWLCVFAVAVTLTAAASLFLYAHPWADDFARGYKGRVQGIAPATIHEYFNWTGRWAAAGLNYLLNSSFDLVRFYTPLLVIIPVFLAAALFLLLRAARIGATRLQSMILSAAGLALYWAGMPDPGETVYWLTGAVDNLTGFGVSFLLLAGLLRYDGKSAKTAAGASAIGLCLALLAVLGTGFHEVFGLVLCVVLAGGALHEWLDRDSSRWIWTVCLTAAVIGFLVVYAAPGNEVRRADFPLAGDLEVTLRLTIKQGALNIVNWVLDARLLTGTALLVMLVPQALTGFTRHPGNAARSISIVMLTWITAVGGAFAAVSWAIGMNMAPRTLNGIYLIFLAGWFWSAVMLGRCFPERVMKLSAARPLIRHVLAAAFVAALLLTGNTRNAIIDLSSASPAYSAAMNERWALINDAVRRGDPDVVVPPLPARPKSYIKHFELSEDPEFWVNWSIAHYFGLKTVRLDHELR